VFGYPTSMASSVAQADIRMAADGFTPGCLDRLEAMLDRGEARQLQCLQCGNLGHELRTYVRGRRYRAVAICTGCKVISEF
jgi:hypothetical protein